MIYTRKIEIESDKMGLGARLRSVRQSKKLTQGEVARRVGKLSGKDCAQSLIGNLEARDTKKSELALQIAHALEVGYIWLATGEGNLRLYDVRKIATKYDQIAPEKLGKRLEQARIESGKDVEEIAAFCETNLATYRAWEKSEEYPSYYQLALFAKYCGELNLKLMLYGHKDKEFTDVDKSSGARKGGHVIAAQSPATLRLISQISDMEASGDLNDFQITKLSELLEAFKTSNLKPDAAKNLKQASEE